MKKHPAINYLKAHRKKSGLTQNDVATLLGYKHKGQVSRHERGAGVPPLAAALAYEALFSAPAASIFAAMHHTIKGDIERELRKLKETIEKRSARDGNAAPIAQKLAWLSRRNSEFKSNENLQ